MAPNWGDFLSPSNISDFFKGLDFPASKQDLISHAEDHDAPPSVIEALAKMPDKQYDSVSEVSSEALKNVV